MSNLGNITREVAARRRHREHMAALYRIEQAATGQTVPGVHPTHVVPPEQVEPIVERAPRTVARAWYGVVLVLVAVAAFTAPQAVAGLAVGLVVLAVVDQRQRRKAREYRDRTEGR